MFWALLLLGVAAAFPDRGALRFEPGKEYVYDYKSTVRLVKVDDILISAQAYFTPVENSEDGIELVLRIEHFKFESLANKGTDEHGHDAKHDFTGWFSFMMTDHGELTRFYHSDNEDKDVLAIKKGIVTLLSGKFLGEREADRIEHGGRWSYNTIEHGHEGRHEASYSVESTPTGRTFTKNRTKCDSIPSHANSLSTKSVKMDANLGTIHSVESTEHVEVTHKSQPRFNPYEGMRNVKPVSDFDKVDIPVMRVEHKGNLVLNRVRDINPLPIRPEDLVPQSICDYTSQKNHFHGQRMSKVGENITSLLQSVQDNLKCIRIQPTTGSKELLECSTDLVKTLLALPDDEVTSLVERIFAVRPKLMSKEMVYQGAILDGLYMMKTKLSQKLIVKYTLKDTTDAELFKRSLLHLGSLDAPLDEDIISFIDITLADDVDALYARYDSEDFHMMLLAFGSLCRRSKDNGMGDDIALKFNAKVKDLLGVHDPYSYRLKRAAMTERAAIEFDWRKVVYLEALGNERHQSSFEHIISHVNASNSPWIKRAAVHALRFYNHTEAAEAIFIAAISDENSEVRQEAQVAYETHPATKTSLSTRLKRFEHADIDTTDLHPRTKRSFLDKEFTFKLEVPGIDWRKTVGTTDIGAAFGVMMHNLFDLKISALSAHFKIEIHDEVYARATLGFLGMNFDFYNARVCFKGGAQYNLNIFQEYDVKLVAETVELLTVGLRDVANTIKEGVELFRSILNGGFTFRDIIDDFLAAFRELPNMVLDLREAAIQAAKDFGDLVAETLAPFLQPLRDLITYVTNLMSDIKMDVMDFYYTLVQAVETTIPNAAGRIFKSIETIISAFPNLFKDPRKSLARIGGGVLGVAISVQELQLVKTQIMSSSFVNGKKPYWMDFDTIFEKIKDMTITAFQTLADGADEWIEEVKGSDDLIATFTGGKMSQASIREMIIERVTEIVERLLEPFDNLVNIGNGFIKKFFEISDIVTEFKDNFNKLKKGYKQARALIDKVFGPKFDTDFPKLVRATDLCAENGFYPSKNYPYQYQGVDLVVEEGAEIVAPLSGVVQRTGVTGQALLTQITELPDDQEILLDNVELDSGILNPSDSYYTDKLVSAGDRIGVATRSDCTNHIHVVLRNKEGIMDPSRLLAPRPAEKPVWKQYCNDRRLVVKGETKIVAPLVEGIETEDTSEQLEDTGDHPTDLDGTQEPTVTGNDMYNALRSDRRRKRSINFLEVSGNLIQALMNHTKAFIEQFSIKRIKLGHVVEFLNYLGMEESIEKVAIVLTRIKGILDDTPCAAPSQMTDDMLQTELVNRGLSMSGDRDKLIETLTNPDTRCPYIAMAMNEFRKMHCSYGKHCLEMECCMVFEITSIIQLTYKAFFRIDVDSSILHIGFNHWRKEIPFTFDPEEDTIDTGIKVELFDGRLLCKYAIEKVTNGMVLSFGCGICSETDDDDCLTFVYLIEKAILPIPQVAEDGTITIPEVDLDTYFDQVRIQEQLSESGEELLEEAKVVLGNRIAEELGIPEDLLKNNPKCSIPGNMDDTEFVDELTERGLDTDGTRSDLEARLTSSYRTCTTNTGHNFTFPAIAEGIKDTFTYEVSPDCMRIDACLDMYFTLFDDTRKTFTAALELDPCNFKLILEFENYSKSKFIIDYEWGKESEFTLTDDFYLRYTLDKTDDEFVVTVALVGEKIPFDSTFIDSFHVPIPVCNENFKLPDKGDLYSFAKAVGGKLSQDAFDVFTEAIGIHDILQNKEKCLLPSDPTSCSYDAEEYIPELFKPYLGCKMLDNCWGVSCCLDFNFTIPFSDTTMEVSIPLFLKFDPCDYYVEINAGNSYKMKKWFVEYEWGTINTLRLGEGSSSPVVISYKVDKIDNVFIFNANMSICLPLEAEIICVPINDTIQLIENVRYPACYLGIDNVEGGLFPDFSLTEWLETRGRNIAIDLGEAGKDYILAYLNLEGVTLETSCDRTADPYSPSISGWNIECATSHIPDFNILNVMGCHVSKDCKTISCCIDIPQIDLSVRIGIDLDICDNKLVAGLEKVNNQIENALSDYKWGENKTVDVAKVFRLTYNITKPATNKYIMNAYFQACFERSGECVVDTHLIRNLELPRIFCRPTDAVEEHLSRTTHQCSMDADLQGITCDVNTDTNTNVPPLSVYVRVEPCLDRYIYVVNDTRWQTILSSLNREMEYSQDVDDTISMSYLIEETPTSYYINVSMDICTDTNDVESCNPISVLDRFPLYKTNCTTSARRRKRRESGQSESTDFEQALQEFNKRDYTNTEINNYLKDMKLQEELLREESFRPIPIEDSDTDAKRASLVKALGKDNPMAMLFANQDSSWDIDVEVRGGDAILDILNETVTAIGKGTQLHVAGDGLTEHGVRVLGKQLAKMTVGDLEGLLELNRVDPLVIKELIMDLVDLAKTLYSETINLITSGSLGNAFDAFEMTLRGTHSYPATPGSFFSITPPPFPLGPVMIQFEFGSDYFYGMQVGVGLRVMSMIADASVTPYAGLSVWGGASIGFILYAEIRLTGHIMQLRMPTMAELEFSRFPLKVGCQMDLVLVPLSLELTGRVTLKIRIPLCCSFRKTLFRKTLWRYVAPGINSKIIDNAIKERDMSPPEFKTLTTDTETISLVDVHSCEVKQVPGLDYTEPAFAISVFAEDDKSQVKFFLDVGTYKGGSDTLEEVKLGGASTKLSMSLDHTGVPLYFTVHAENSQGARTSVQCSLQSYDITEPTGRVSADFLSSSNRYELGALLTLHDDTELEEVFAAIGYGEEIYGDQVVPWHTIQLNEASNAQDAGQGKTLKHFSGVKDGKLLGGVLESRQDVSSIEECAKWCLTFPVHSCLSINYDFGSSSTCEISNAVEGHDHVLVKDKLFAHCERLGTGHSYEVKESNLELKHNYLYKVNTHMKNTLGYSNVISSTGILIDLTPPDPGVINEALSDETNHIPCATLLPGNRPDLIRYCVGLDHTTPNNRIIKDGALSETVFNGMNALFDQRYTRITNYISGNWDGFHDNETSIRGYSWAVGTGYCQEQIVQFTDPHAHLSSQSQWNNVGQIHPIPPPYTILPDGQYYVTVRALNGVEYGGPLALTVCHTTPYVVDTSPPFVDDIYNIKYNENTFFLDADIDVSDPHSGIAEYDVCLGATSHDCNILAWHRYDYGEFPKLSQRFQLPDGVPTWLRVRAVNNVQLTAVGVADRALVVDESSPIVGSVFDGPVYGVDLQYSKDVDQICVNWIDFHDPESGISEYLVGIGNTPGLTDVVELRTVDSHQHFTCLHMSEEAQLSHGSKYYAIVYAINGGIVRRKSSAVSNGVVIDLTPPEEGQVVDGSRDDFQDIQYSSSASSVAVQWRDYSDPESGISDYKITVVNIRSEGETVVKDWTSTDTSRNTMEWRNLQLEHADFIRTKVNVTNGATNSITSETDGFLVDLTAPVLKYIHDGDSIEEDARFQSDPSLLTVNFLIEDLESGVKTFRFQVYEKFNGQKRRIWPVDREWNEEVDTTITSSRADELSLVDGAIYSFMITSENNAGLISIHESNGVMLDNSPPVIKWLRVGVFYGEEEDIHDGYVYQADHGGIKLSYLAVDPQSGITETILKVGTTKGSDDIKTITSVERDVYINDILLSDTDLATMTPVYYVTLQVKSGAGEYSDEVYSTPIVVVPEDVPGNVVEGITQDDDIIQGDIDYSFDDTTMAITFDGFRSTLHGITSFVWAVGTAPDREDVLPFTEKGIIYEETFDAEINSGIYSGVAHLPVSLDHGQLYFVTIRGITNNGHALQSVTDGIMIDKTPPSVTIERLLDHDIDAENDSVFYESSITSLTGTWTFNDEEIISDDFLDNIEMVTVSVGAFPGGSDIQPSQYSLSPTTDEGQLDAAAINDASLPTFLSVTVENKGGLSTTVVSPAIVLDDTAPTPGVVSCSQFVQMNVLIKCEWSGFTDQESPIRSYKFYMGSQAGNDDVLQTILLNASINAYNIQATDILSEHGDTFFATVVAVNSVNKKEASFSNAIVIDTTPPSSGTVVELEQENVIQDEVPDTTEGLCSSEEECLVYDSICQTSLTSVTVSWSPFYDDESGIDSYLIAIGVTESDTDVMEFKEIDVDSDRRRYTVTGLNLMGVAKIHVKIKAVNGAGLASVSTSNGVYLSRVAQGLPPLSAIGIWDADDGISGDIDNQAESSTLHAAWDTTGEPCPAVKYEWKILRLDGETMQDYRDATGSTKDFNDQLFLKDGEWYYSLLRVTNADGFVYILRSDGVTINSQPLSQGMVYDGDVVGYDLNVVLSSETVTCNWGGFGRIRLEDHEEVLAGTKVDENEMVDDRQISYYQVGLGTDRRYPSTRTNIVPFTNVGLSTSHTFTALNLVPGTAKYYCTVEAYSSTLSATQAWSNGFSVSYNGGVTAGTIHVPVFTPSQTDLEIPWSGFTSQEGMMLYYVAVSTQYSPVAVDCQLYIDGGSATTDEKSALFDVKTVLNVGDSTVARFQDLSLLQGATYYIFVIGVDHAGECNMKSVTTTVDVTEPDRGFLTGGPYFDMSLSYTQDSSSIEVRWEGYDDDVSGITSYTVSMWRSISCDNTTVKSQVGDENILGADIFTFTFGDIELETSVPYFVKLSVMNGAGLLIEDITEPILYDASSPTAGTVVEGTDFTEDIVWWGSTSEITGTILHYPTADGNPCPLQIVPVDDASWTLLDGNPLLDDDDATWNLAYKSEFVTFDSVIGAARLKMAKDSKYDNTMISSGFWRVADMASEATYQVSMKAASEQSGNENNVVTEIMFIDGDTDSSIKTHYYQEEVDWSTEDCGCCFDSSQECGCTDCAAYLNSLSEDGTTEEESTLDRTKACGFQIYTGTEHFGIIWCHFEDAGIPVMELRTSLPEDVADTFNNYKIQFLHGTEDDSDQICMSVFIEGSELGSLCGIPNLSATTNFLIHVWNRDRFLPSPDHDLFTWSVYAEVESSIFPAGLDELCRYGEPFRGGSNPIVSYEAAIGSEAGLSDIHPYEKVLSPCLPCQDTCSRFNCEESCNPSEMKQLLFTLDGLNLQSTRQEDNVSELIVYYLSVKAVLGSGENAVSSSNGFYVDVTPPEFDDEPLLYIDVDQGDFTPVEYQGSSSTIKAIWFCSDDESEIMENLWAIGSTDGLQDIQPFTSTDQNSTGINDDLEGILQHNRRYFVSVICKNSAGIETTYSDSQGVVVLLEPPSTDNVDGHIVAAEPFSYEINPTDAMKTTDQTSIGTTIEVSVDATRYDFCLGSTNESHDDILPCVWVAHNASCEVKIENGAIYYNGEKMYDLNELETDLSSSTADGTGGTFNMEPGRIIFVSVRVHNEAERFAYKAIGTVTIFTSTTESGVSDGVHSIVLTATINTGGRRKKRSVPDIDIQLTTPADLLAGETVLLVPLTNADLTAEYTSSASDDFIPYIVNPNTTLTSVERILENRIEEFVTSFSISTVGQLAMPGPLSITFTQTNTDPLPGENILALIHWNTVDQEWKLTEYTCQFENSTSSQNTGTTTVKVCNTRTLGVVEEIYFKEETQFAVVLMKSDVVNNAPTLVSPTHLSFNEDQAGGYIYQLLAEDPENDTYGFLLIGRDSNPIVSQFELSQNGSLSFELCVHCYGNLSFEMSIYDEPQSSYVGSQSTNITITITINSTNDPPNIFLVDDYKNSLLGDDVTEEVQIFSDGTSVYYTAIVGAYDYDTGDTLVLLNQSTSTGDYTVDVFESAYQAVVNCNDTWCMGKVPEKAPSETEWVFARITYRKSTSFVSKDSVKIGVQDSSGVLSDIVTIAVYNLELPCLNGGWCLPKTQLPCDNPVRLSNFDDNYSCVCPVGWVGIHCGEDVDECLSSPCSSEVIAKECENTPGSYSCNVPLVTIIGLVIACSLVVLIPLSIYVGRRLWQRWSRDRVKKFPDSKPTTKKYTRDLGLENKKPAYKKKKKNDFIAIANPAFESSPNIANAPGVVEGGVGEQCVKMSDLGLENKKPVYHKELEGKSDNKPDRVNVEPLKPSDTVIQRNPNIKLVPLKTKRAPSLGHQPFVMDNAPLPDIKSTALRLDTDDRGTQGLAKDDNNQTAPVNRKRAYALQKIAHRGIDNARVPAPLQPGPQGLSSIDVFQARSPIQKRSGERILQSPVTVASLEPNITTKPVNRKRHRDIDNARVPAPLQPGPQGLSSIDVFQFGSPIPERSSERVLSSPVTVSGLELNVTTKVHPFYGLHRKNSATGSKQDVFSADMTDIASVGKDDPMAGDADFRHPLPGPILFPTEHHVMHDGKMKVVFTDSNKVMDEHEC